MIYEVVVGKIGLVYQGADYRLALTIFDNYVLLSKAGTGQAGGQTVTMYEQWHRSAPFDVKHEYIGTDTDTDTDN